MPAKVAQPAASTSAAAPRPLRRTVKSSSSSSASAPTPSSRAPSTSSRASRPATTSTAATSAAASAKSVPVASSSPQPMDQQTLVASFKTVDTTTSRAITDLLRHLETTPARLGLQLLEPAAAAASAPSSATSEPSSPSREIVQLAKEVVNASFTAIGQLCAARSNDKSSSSPSPLSKNLLHLVDAFRIALRVVFAAKSSRAASSSNRWQTHQVAQTHLKRAVALGVTDGLRQEVAYLRSQILQQEAKTEQLPSDAELLRYDVPTDLDQTQCSLVLDLQSLLLNQLAEVQEKVTLKRMQSILAAVADEERGVKAWQQAATDASAAQRLPFAVERCLSKLSSALPNVDDVAAAVILEARKQGVLWLLNANLDGGDEATTAARRAQVVARIERMAISHWKEANARGSKQAAWGEVNAALEEVEASAEEGWKALKEWSKLVETWRWLAVKNGDVVAASRLAGSPAASSAPSSSQQDIGVVIQKATSCCSHAVSSLDVLRADTSATVASVAPSLQAATQALVNLVAAGDASRSVDNEQRQALLKLLDRLRRRCCAGIEAWLRQGENAVVARRLFNSALEAESQQIVASVRGGGKQEELVAGATGNASGFRTLGLSLYDAGEEEEALTCLSRGVDALKALVSEDGQQHSFSAMASEQLSLLDAALYHVGGRIYTARRYALAVRFIEAAAKAGGEAQRLSPATAPNDDGSRAHSLFKKWDYAAACHRLLSRPKDALVALRHSLASLPPHQWQQLEELASTKAVEDVFESEECSALARSLRALFEVSVFELLAKPDDDADEGDDVAAVLRSTAASSAAQAICIEYLVSSAWIQGKMHTEGAEEAVAALLQTLPQLVDAQKTPLRRARVLLHRFERAALGAGPLQDLELNDDVSTLLAASQLGQDAELARQLPVLRCRHHLLAVLAAARKEGTSVKMLVEVAKAAIESVRGLFEVQGSQNEKRTSAVGTGRTPPLRSTSAPKQATTRPATQSRAQSAPRTVSKAATARPRPAAKPTTSRPRAGVKAAPVAPSAAPVTPPRKAAPVRKQPIEGSAGVIDLLLLTCDYLSAFGQTLLSIELLQHLRRVTSDMKEDADTWARATITLARQNIALGRVSRAESLVASLSSASTDVRCAAAFVHAQLLHGDEATRRYEEALDAAAALEEEQDGGSRAGLGKVLSKVARYRRISAAAEAFSCIAADHGDSTKAIEGAFHATQYSIRAASLLARVTTYQTDSASQADDVAATLSSPAKKDPAQAAAEAQEAGVTTANKTSLSGAGPRPHRLLSVKIASTHWQVQRDLLSCFQRLAYLYQLRGSARDAEMFAGEAVDLAAGLDLHLSTSQSLLIRAEVRLQLGKRAEGEEDVAKALRLLSDVWLPEAATLACIQGDQLAKTAETREDALRAYQTGQETVRALRRAYTEVEQAVPSPRGLPTSASTRSSLGGKTPRGSSIGGGAFAEGLLAEMHCRLLRRQAWLLQVLGRSEESEAMMVQADAMQPSSDDLLACGRLLLDKALRGMSSDPIWGMVSDAVVALPSSKAVAPVKSSRGRTPAKAVLQSLSKAESAFAAVTDDASRCCAVSIRRAYKGLALSTMLHRTFLQQAADLDDMLDMLDSAAAVTLQREARHAVWSKLEVAASSKEVWLPWNKSEAIMASNRRGQSVKAIQLPSSSRAHSPLSDDEDEHHDEEKGEAPAWRNFWREKQEGLTSDAALPSNWTVVSIGLSRQRNALVISRRSASSTPMILSLPFDRRRDEEDDDEDSDEAEATTFDLDAAQRELKDIVTSSNALTFAARNVSVSEDMEQRKAWWTSRRELDTRMKTLCGAIEERWLGAFKSVWAEAVGEASSAAMEGLRANLDAIVQRMCFPHQATKQRAAVKIELDDAIYDLVARIVPSTTTDEELEDLLHFIMDIHQLNGVPVAVDEADFDMLAYDLRAAIEEYRSASAREGQRKEESSSSERHVFLVLDKDTAAIPWESLPSLRGRAVCRIPSMSFLTDRVEMARRLGASQDDDGAFHLPRDCRAYYLLNPSKDLVKSQERFEPFLRGKPSWRGVIGRAPAPNDFAQALETYPLVLYFGHSGAEQYVRAARLRAMQKCAVTMLWGCSSAVLRDQGDFDRTGTPYNYMLAGSPCVVGQLFDATDKELDSVSEAVLIKCGLREDKEKATTKTMSLAQAVAQSRDSCRLPYLTGAAPVVYGVPVYFDR